MIRSLWTAATGMQAQSLNVDVISNNIANVSTTGFKKSRSDFQDLLYETVRMPGSASSEENQVPTGIQVGHGTRPVSVRKIYTQGDFQNTQEQLDLAIEGNGFFQILQPGGEIAYTRAGAFKINNEGTIVTSDGFPLEPEITVPEDAIQIYVGVDGTVSALSAGEQEPTELGTLQLTMFINPSGLKSVGRNLMIPTPASGEGTTGTGGQNGFGTIAQGFLEMSNVSVVDEMVNLIVAQRAYEINSKAIQTSDEMLQTANNVKR